MHSGRGPRHAPSADGPPVGKPWRSRAFTAVGLVAGHDRRARPVGNRRLLASHRSRRPEPFTPLVRRHPRGLATPLSPTRPEMTLRGAYDQAMGSYRPGGCCRTPDAHRCRPGSGGCTPGLLAPRTPRTALQSPSRHPWRRARRVFRLGRIPLIGSDHEHSRSLCQVGPSIQGKANVPLCPGSCRIDSQTRILDVGGSHHIWTLLPVTPRVVLLNLSADHKRGDELHQCPRGCASVAVQGSRVRSDIQQLADRAPLHV